MGGPYSSNGMSRNQFGKEREEGEELDLILHFDVD